MAYSSTKKKSAGIVQISIGILTVILVVLIIAMMMIVSSIQGTARIVNYAVRRWNNTLRDKGVLCFCLCLHEHTALIYVVRMSRLQNDLSDPAVGEFLSSFGYTSQNAIDALLVLRQHLMQSDTFPHEIGIFLGYPLADVKGFIINHGHNCLCCGDWKVYSDPENAVKTFRRYCKCKQIYRRMWEQGKDLRQLTVSA